MRGLGDVVMSGKMQMEVDKGTTLEGTNGNL